MGRRIESGEMPREFVEKKYGWYPFEGNETHAVAQRLNVAWERDNEDSVVLYVQKLYENVTQTAGGTDELARIGLTRREINQLIAWLRRARNQAFGADE